MVSVDVYDQPDAAYQGDDYLITIDGNWESDVGESFAVGDQVFMEHLGSENFFEIADTHVSGEDVSGPDEPADWTYPEPVRMNFSGRSRFYAVGATVPSTLFSVGMTTNNLEHGAIRQGDSTWRELIDDFACRFSSEAQSFYGVDVGDRVEITNGDTGASAIYKIMNTASWSEGSEPNIIRMSEPQRARIGLDNVSSGWISSVDEVSGSWDLTVQKVDNSWPESSDVYACRISETMERFGHNGRSYDDPSFNDYVLEVESDVSGNSGLWGVYDVADGTRDDAFAKPQIFMNQRARSERLGASDNTEVTVLDIEPDEEDIPRFYDKARAGWPEVGDDYSVRISTGMEDEKVNQLGDYGVGGDVIEFKDGTVELMGVVDTHPSNYTMIETVRLGLGARDRLGVDAYDEVDPDWEVVDVTPVFLDYGQSEWGRGAYSEFNARVPEELFDIGILSQSERFIIVESQVNGESAVYGVDDQHNMDYSIMTVRMGKLARERMNAAPYTERQVEFERYLDDPKNLPVHLDYAQSEWDNAGDFFAQRVSPVFEEIYANGGFYLDKEDRFWVKSEYTGEEQTYGVWDTHSMEPSWPSVRMGQNGREQLGAPSDPTPDPLIGTDLTVKDGDRQEPHPEIHKGLPSWDSEIRNPLLVGISEEFKKETGLDVGDYVEIKVRDRWRVFRVSRIYPNAEDGGTDRMRSVFRMARWARYRFAETGNGENEIDTPIAVSNGGETLQGDNTGWRRYDKDENEHYVGVYFSKSEWDFVRASEEMGIHPDLFDVYEDLEPMDLKYTNYPTSPDDRGPDRTDGTWDNIRLYQADYPEERYAGYTPQGTYTDDIGIHPTIRMARIARERLNDPSRDAEEDQVPNGFVARIAPNNELGFGTFRRHPTSQYISNNTNSGAREMFSDEAQQYEEANEFFREGPPRRKFISLAMHAGFMENMTGIQSWVVADELNCAIWLFEGNRLASGSFDRWHITSSDVNDGFAGKTHMYPTDYNRAMMFNGYSDDPFLVGGLMDDSLLETYGYDYIDPIIDAEVEVCGVDVSGDNNPCGENPLTIPNRMCRDGPNGLQGGMQVEQSRTTRENHGIEIAKATAQFIKDIEGPF